MNGGNGTTEDRKTKTAPSGLSRLFVARRPVRIEAGFTLLELIITLVIISILAAGTVPVARNLVRRQRENELRRNLRELRRGLDAYHQAAVAGRICFLDAAKHKDMTRYPPDLDVLVKGVSVDCPGGGLTPGQPAAQAPTTSQQKTLYFLRRIPVDPFLPRSEWGKPPEETWGKRSMNDPPDGTSWDGKSVYDVHSKSQERALDGTWYKDW